MDIDMYVWKMYFCIFDSELRRVKWYVCGSNMCWFLNAVIELDRPGMAIVEASAYLSCCCVGNMVLRKSWRMLSLLTYGKYLMPSFCTLDACVVFEMCLYFRVWTCLLSNTLSCSSIETKQLPVGPDASLLILRMLSRFKFFISLFYIFVQTLILPFMFLKYEIKLRVNHVNDNENNEDVHDWLDVVICKRAWCV